MEGANKVKEAVEAGKWEDATNWWSSTEGIIMNVAYGIDFYNVLLKIPYFGFGNKKVSIPGSENAVLTSQYSLNSIMNQGVKKALGLPSDAYWSESSGTVFNALWGDFMKPVIHVGKSLI